MTNIARTHQVLSFRGAVTAAHRSVAVSPAPTFGAARSVLPFKLCGPTNPSTGRCTIKPHTAGEVKR